jgi:acetyl-CoA synthetase
MPKLTSAESTPKPSDASSAASPATVAYAEARDLLLALGDSHDEALARFTWPDVGQRFNWAIDWFDAVAARTDRAALIIVEADGRQRDVSYPQMSSRSNGVARWLAALGVERGDRVMLMLGNQAELWESMLAIMKLGGVIVPTTPSLGTPDLADRITRGGVKHVIATPEDVHKFEAIPGAYTRIVVGDPCPDWTSYAGADACDTEPLEHPATAPTDPLLVYFTSGTTSRPKLVEHTQVSYPVGHLSTMYWIGLRPDDLHLNISSPGWAKHAFSSFFAPWIAEATVVVHNYRRFDARALLTLLRTMNVTTFCAAPTVWRMLITQDLSAGPGALREIVSAGEPLNPEVIESVRGAWGLTLRDGYGQTETTASIANTPGSLLKPGSMGRPLPGCPIVLVDPTTGEPGDEGEICLDLSRHPLALMSGYQGDPEVAAAAMSGGYYHTGDMAARDADGYITYIGRTDDVFKSSDYKISPFELENVLIEHPAVVEAAVVPAHDPLRLTVPKAYICLADEWAPDSATALSIFEHAHQRLAPYLRIRRIEFAELPKTTSGKIRRVELRRREERNRAANVEPGWRDDQFPELRTRIRPRHAES